MLQKKTSGGVPVHRDVETGQAVQPSRKFRRNHIGGLQSVKIRRIFRQPNYFSADFRQQ